MERTCGSVAFISFPGLAQAVVWFCLTLQALLSQTPSRPVVTHEGPLVLKGNQVYTIENVTFIQHGPIEVYEQAQLVIRDASVEFRQDYHDQLSWRFYGSARLIIERSRVNSAHAHVVNLFGSSRAQVSTSELTQAEIIANDTATVSIADSTLDGGVVISHQEGIAEQSPAASVSGGRGHGLDFRLRGRATGTVRGLRDHGYVTWTPNELKDARLSVQVTNTWVDSSHWAIGGDGRITFQDCDLQSVGAADSAFVSVRNTHPYRAEMQIENSHRATLRSLISGQRVARWSLHEADPATNVPFDYTIENSRIDGWHIRARGDLTLEDCDPRGSRLRPEFNTSGAKVRVIRTYVEDLMLWWSYGTIAFQDSKVGLVRNPAEATPTITGTVRRFEQKSIDTANGPWRQATITREFPVRVIQTNGKPLAGLPLRLNDPDGRKIWSGQTGADGGASFQIAFTDANNEKTWTLRFGTSEPAITIPVRFLSDTPLMPPIPLNSPAIDHSALSGKYHFVQLLASAPAGETRTLGGSISFDGQGGHSWTTDGLPGARGAYSVGGAGEAGLASPIRTADWLSAYVSGDGDVLVGASTFSADSSYDFFAAVRAPPGSVTNAVLNGNYGGAWLEFAPGSPGVRKSGLVSLAANGAGQFTRVTVTGHASDQGGRTVTQSIAGATYNLRPDGTGAVSLGTAASLFSGERQILVARDGSYFVGHLPNRKVLVAAKNAQAGADFEGRYWTAGLSVDGPNWSASSGSLRTLGAGRAVVTERRRVNEQALDYAGLRSYAVSQDGTGALAPVLPRGLSNLRLVATAGPVEAPRAGAFAGAQIGLLNESTSEYGVFLGVRAPVFHPSGVFLDPAGVVNAASFAGWPYPLAPGAIVSLFGSSLAAREARASGFPLPSKLDDVTVAVNGTPAPLYFVSPAQAGIQIPYGLSGRYVTLRVSNSRGNSNEVVALLAPTRPGVFAQTGSRPVVPHSDYLLVSEENPARPGETVMIWLTGLGELSPAVTTGAANPDSPPARAADVPIGVLFGGIPASGVDFAGGAPGFGGLCQINAVVPLNAPTGPSVTVAISTGNAYVELVAIPSGR